MFNSVYYKCALAQKLTRGGIKAQEWGYGFTLLS